MIKWNWPDRRNFHESIGQYSFNFAFWNEWKLFFYGKQLRQYHKRILRTFPSSISFPGFHLLNILTVKSYPTSPKCYRIQSAILSHGMDCLSGNFQLTANILDCEQDIFLQVFSFRPYFFQYWIGKFICQLFNADSLNNYLIFHLSQLGVVKRLIP